MTDINKQKFLAELGKLLTFMYEEDRQTALAMYEKMFDDAEDEQTLLHALVSPTRQAVVVARSYDAKERKLQVQSQSRGEDDAQRESLPGFVLAIHQVYENAVPQRDASAPVLRDQVSLFEPAAPAAPQNEVLAETVSVVSAASDSAADMIAAPESPGPAPLPTEDVPAAAEAAEDTEEIAAAPADEVDGFLEDFHLEIDEALPEAAAPTEAAQVLPEESFALPAVRSRPRALLLVLFWILALPLTIVGVVLLLVPTLLSLGLAVGLIAAGSAAVIGAFSGFAVFADILLVLGLAIILLALGLLFLWLFVWFIGGAIVGLIRGVAALSRRWCYEEVPV